MIWKALTLAAAAAAFIIVPEVPPLSPPPEEQDTTMRALPIDTEPLVPMTIPTVAFAQSLRVPCPECSERDSHLKLDFTVDPSGSRLLLNDMEVYPDADAAKGGITAAVVDEASGEETRHRLSYRLDITQGPRDHAQHLDLLGIDIELGNRAVMGLPVVRVKLVKTATENIYIGNVFVDETSAPPRRPSMWCRAKNWVVAMLRLMKGYTGCSRVGHQQEQQQQEQQQQQAEPWGGDDADDFVFVDMDRPGNQSPEKEQQHNWRQLLRTIVSHIFLPVLMGITAGVGVAIFAMALCGLAVRLTRLATGKYRGGSHCCPKRRQHTDESASPDQKVGLVEAECEEAPPKYSDDTLAK